MKLEKDLWGKEVDPSKINVLTGKPHMTEAEKVGKKAYQTAKERKKVYFKYKPKDYNPKVALRRNGETKNKKFNIVIPKDAKDEVKQVLQYMAASDLPVKKITNLYGLIAKVNKDNDMIYFMKAVESTLNQKFFIKQPAKQKQKIEL